MEEPYGQEIKMEYKISDIESVFHGHILQKTGDSDYLIKINDKQHSLKILKMNTRGIEFVLDSAVHTIKYIDAGTSQMKMVVDGTPFTVNMHHSLNEIVYKNYYNIGVAVGTEKGLVVPVVRDADELSFADIEKQIIVLGEKAKTGQLSIEELQGGTFTITNGGIYGSMLSTPILNPPQSGVLGMHNIVQRAVVVDGKIEVRPIMYLALSYDHRIIDGKDAVSFLVRVKEYLEDPRRLFLNL